MDRQPELPEVSIAHPLVSFEWKEQANLPVPMCGAKAVWHNERFHIGGGVTSSSPRKEETRLYSFSLDNSEYEIRTMPTYYYGLTVYGDHLAFVGGVEYQDDTITNKVWLLKNVGEKGERRWTEDSIPPMPTKRYGVSAVGHRKLLLVAGGCDNTFHILDTVEVYNSDDKQWQATTALPQHCYWLTSTIMGDHLVFVGGEGQKRNVYRCSLPQDGILSSPLTWESLVEVPFKDSAITSSNGSLLAIGGWRGRLSKAAMCGLSSQDQEWRFLCELPLLLACSCIAVSPDGVMLAIGGLSDSGYSSKVFKLNIKKKAAIELSSIIQSGVELGLVALVERALTAVKEHSHSSQPVDGSLLLDFLAHSSSPNVSSIEHSPLMIACANENTNMVDVLLENGASPSYKNKDDVTAVHVACSKNNLEIVQRLVDSDGGLTQQATTNLLQMTDKEGQNVLHYTCASPYGIQTLNWLLEKKAVRDMLNNTTNTGLTPLLTACHHGNKPMVEVLVTHDQVDTAVCDENNQGALHLAAQHESSSIVELLLEQGCPSDAQDCVGNTALHIAYKKSSNSVITVLTNVDDGRIAVIMNKAGQLPAEIEPDNIIPPEILKKGSRAVQLYLDALMKGETKIPRCNLLVLGEERVGKTSLYRLLVLKGFDPNQESTRGIDNTIVDTMVDIRCIGAEDCKWAEKDESMVKQHAEELFAEGVICVLPSDLLVQTQSDIPIGQALDDHIAKLEEQLSKLLSEIEQFSATKTDIHSTRPQDQATDQSINSEDQSQSSQQKSSADSKKQVSNEENSNQPSKQQSDLAVTNDTNNENDQLQRTVPKVSTRHVMLINQKIQTGGLEEKEEPVLILNTLDFAGQKEYRPMHHCFLTMRTIYLVVFNLRHIMLYRQQKSDSNPFEEIRYWIHSIHVHTLPAFPGKEKKALKNVCLVGTHRGPLNENKGKRIEDKELKEINDLIIDEIYSDDRCSGHLHFMGPKGDMVFAAVENSIDGEEMKDREASGAKALQEEIKAASQNLPFSREKYPVVWLNFEQELIKLKETLKQNNSSLVVKVEQILKIATQCGITNTDGQFLALEFYHETGKIVCLKFLPPLFISEEEHAELEELVLLDPTWLIRVMTKVLELNYRLSIEGMLIHQLSETGVASCDLLKEAWSGYLQEPKEQSFHQMCLILQAEALIHPIRIIPKSESSSEVPPPLAPADDTLPNSASKAATTDTRSKLVKEYLVPGKLPDKMKKEPVKCSGWKTFYFDFQKFLPEEIYHRLLCRMLAVCQQKKSFDKSYLSKNKYLLKNLDSCDWCVEMESEKHRLKISVLSSDKDPREPTYYITTIHTEYLQKICLFSNLEGMRYVGGPLLDPCTQCGETHIVRYVSYFEGEDRPSQSECPNCHKTCNVHQLLTNQVKGATAVQATAQSASSPKVTLPIDPGKFSSAPPPNLQNLTLIRWKNDKGETKRCRVIRSICPKWHEVGRVLGISGPELSTISLKNQKDPELCCTEVVTKWLEVDSQSLKWAGVFELLEDIEETTLLKELENALHTQCN